MLINEGHVNDIFFIFLKIALETLKLLPFYRQLSLIIFHRRTTVRMTNQKIIIDITRLRYVANHCAAKTNEKMIEVFRYLRRST